MYKNKLNSDENILYASLFIFVGIVSINYLIPKVKNNKENFTDLSIQELSIQDPLSLEPIDFSLINPDLLTPMEPTSNDISGLQLPGSNSFGTQPNIVITLSTNDLDTLKNLTIFNPASIRNVPTNDDPDGKIYSISDQSTRIGFYKYTLITASDQLLDSIIIYNKWTQGNMNVIGPDGLNSGLKNSSLVSIQTINYTFDSYLSTIQKAKGVYRYKDYSSVDDSKYLMLYQWLDYINIDDIYDCLSYLNDYISVDKMIPDHYKAVLQQLPNSINPNFNKILIELQKNLLASEESKRILVNRQLMYAGLL